MATAFAQLLLLIPACGSRLAQRCLRTLPLCRPALLSCGWCRLCWQVVHDASCPHCAVDPVLLPSVQLMVWSCYDVVLYGV